MKLRPLHDRVVVKRIESEEGTVGGLFIPDSAKEKPHSGEIVAVGPGKRLDSGEIVPLDVQVGDRILFGKYSGSEIKLDGEDYLIMREDEVLGLAAESADVWERIARAEPDDFAEPAADAAPGLAGDSEGGDQT